MRSVYHSVSIGLHWLMALLITGLVGCGFYMTGLVPSPEKFLFYGLHKSFGLIVLGLVVLRFLWRLYVRPPAALANHKPWERILAHLTHWVFYLLMLGLPISGLLMSAAGDFPVRFFNLFSVPALIGKDEVLLGGFREMHEIMATIIMVMIAVHAAGALKHHLIDRDQTLARMAGPLGLTGAGVLVLFVGLLYMLTLFVIATKNEEGEADAALSRSPAAVSASAPAQSDFQDHQWAMIPQQSRIRFTATQNGQEFSGTFEGITGTIVFNPADLSLASADIIIDVSSLNTGSTERNQQAQSADWFDISHYPQAHFRASNFEKGIEAHSYVAQGVLTLRGVSVTVSLPFSLNIEEDEGQKIAHMQSNVTLNRQDFGIGQGQWADAKTIGHEVKIDVQVTATDRPFAPSSY